MIIALNIFMAGLVVVGLVTLLAKQIEPNRPVIADRALTPTAVPQAELDPRHAARTRSRTAAGSRSVGSRS